MAFRCTFIPNKDCPKCKGVGSYTYDSNHAKPCELCCVHAHGWWQMHQHYGDNNGKWACADGCGFVVDDPPPLDVRSA